MYLGLAFFAEISFYITNTSLHNLRLTYPSTFPTSSPRKLRDKRQLSWNWVCTCLGLNWQLSAANISNPTHTAYILLSYSWIYMSLCQIKHYEDAGTSGCIDLPPRLMEVSDQRHGSIALPPTVELVYQLKRRLVESMRQSGFCDPTGNRNPKSHYPDSTLVIILD